jgi:hypothetical protein
MALAYAPGAVVQHERRGTIGDYLKQQRGYGHAEGLLFRKYPQRQDRIYGDSHWIVRWFGGGPQIYYGEYGRGLFQTAYLRSRLPLAVQLPVSIQWIAVTTLLALMGIFDKTFGTLGAAGWFVTLACAVAAAQEDGGQDLGFVGRVLLVGLWVLGPLVRSWERELVKWSFAPDTTGETATIKTRLGGTLPLVAQLSESAQRDKLPRFNLDKMISALQLSLVRRGLAVAKGTDYDPFDLQVIVAPFIRIAVLFLRRGDTISLRWQVGAAGRRIAASLASLLLILLVGGFSVTGALAISALVAVGFGTLALRRARRVPAVINAASTESAAQSETESEVGGQGALADDARGKATS